MWEHVLVEKFWKNVKQWCLYNVFTLFHYANEHWLGAFKNANI
jgi:hypothetical protein